jgi:hypothetical protein
MIFFALAGGTHPDRRVGLLCGRRLDNDIVELLIFSAMRERLVGSPRLENNAERLVEPRVGFLHRHAEAGKLAVAIALADPKIEPSAGQQILLRSSGARAPIRVFRDG